MWPRSAWPWGFELNRGRLRGNANWPLSPAGCKLRPPDYAEMRKSSPAADSFRTALDAGRHGIHRDTSGCAAFPVEIQTQASGAMRTVATAEIIVFMSSSLPRIRQGRASLPSARRRTCGSGGVARTARYPEGRRERFNSLTQTQLRTVERAESRLRLREGRTGTGRAQRSHSAGKPSAIAEVPFCLLSSSASSAAIVTVRRGRSITFVPYPGWVIQPQWDEIGSGVHALSRQLAGFFSGRHQKQIEINRSLRLTPRKKKSGKG
jgi:hypothetical protein